MKFRIEDLVTPEQERVAKLFQCPICLGVLHDPVQTACDHHFCSECLQQTQSGACPVCKFVLDAPDIKPLKEVNVSMYRMMCKIPVLCPYREQEKHSEDGTQTKRPRTDRSCAWSGSYSDLFDQHLTVCESAPVQCGHCAASFPRRDIEQHEQTCEHRLEQCPICGERMRSEAQHMQDAAMVHVKILQAKLEEKEKEKKDAAAAVVTGALQTLHNEYKKQQTEIAKCSKTTLVTRKLDEVKAKVDEAKAPGKGYKLVLVVKGVEKMIRDYDTWISPRRSSTAPFYIELNPKGDTDSKPGHFGVFVGTSGIDPQYQYEVEVAVGTMKDTFSEVAGGNVYGTTDFGTLQRLRQDTKDDAIVVSVRVINVQYVVECQV